MKCSVIAFTREGGALSLRICKGLRELGYDTTGYVFQKYETEGLQSFSKLQPLVAQLFETEQALIFVGATGIAVRGIAPHLKSKVTDPAVLVLDEAGTFVISLLAGHIGGGNDLANELASQLKATPVITTATDVQGKLAIDSWAVKRNLYIQEMSLAKEVAAALLEGQDIGYVCELEGEEYVMPQGFTQTQTPKLGVYVGNDGTKQPFEQTLHLLGKDYVMGIGCRRDTPYETITEAVNEALLHNRLQKEQISGLYSIDLKQDEQGLLQLSHTWNVAFTTYTAEELNEVEGTFTGSEFVKKTTGVDNVCERSAVRGSNGGALIQKKLAKNGVTVAIAKRSNEQ